MSQEVGCTQAQHEYAGTPQLGTSRKIHEQYELGSFDRMPITPGAPLQLKIDAADKKSGAPVPLLEMIQGRSAYTNSPIASCAVGIPLEAFTPFS